MNVLACENMSPEGWGECYALSTLPLKARCCDVVAPGETTSFMDGGKALAENVPVHLPTLPSSP